LQYRWPFNLEKSDLTKEPRNALKLGLNELLNNNNNENEHDKDDNEFLYITLTYFNFAQSKRRKQLFFEFIDYLLVGDFENSQRVRIIVIEAVLTEEHKTNISSEFELPNLMKNKSLIKNNVSGGIIYSHYKHKLHTIFWCKENLINFASMDIYINLN
jgi:hypothetical protein